MQTHNPSLRRETKWYEPVNYDGDQGLAYDITVNNKALICNWKVFNVAFTGDLFAN